jgi:hypothetical protein
MHTVFGPVVGAAVVVGLQYYLDALGGWVTLITGVVFMVCVLSFRKGIVGTILEKVELRRGAGRASTRGAGLAGTKLQKKESST